MYKKYEDKLLLTEGDKDNHNMIRKYLLEDSEFDASEQKVKKPIMWIHIKYEYNARKWLSFGSRSSCELNQPYLYLTLKSIYSIN